MVQSACTHVHACVRVMLHGRPPPQQSMDWLRSEILTGQPTDCTDPNFVHKIVTICILKTTIIIGCSSFHFNEYQRHLNLFDIYQQGLIITDNFTTTSNANTVLFSILVSK